MPWEMSPKVCCMDSSAQKVRFYGSQRLIRCQKRPILGDYYLKSAIWHRISDWDPVNLTFSTLESLQYTLGHNSQGILSKMGHGWVLEAKIGLEWPISAISPLKLAFLTSNWTLRSLKSNFLCSRIPQNYLGAQFSWHNPWKWATGGF